jgi:sterol 14-demethylase
VDLKKEFANLIAKTAARTLLGREIREQLFDQVGRSQHTAGAGGVQGV